MAQSKKTIQQCRACRYSWNMNGKPSCQYILVEGRQRGCSVENCEKFVKGTKLKAVYPANWGGGDGVAMIDMQAFRDDVRDEMYLVMPFSKIDVTTTDFNRYSPVLSFDLAVSVQFFVFGNLEKEAMTYRIPVANLVECDNGHKRRMYARSIADEFKEILKAHVSKCGVEAVEKNGVFMRKVKKRV